MHTISRHGYAKDFFQKYCRSAVESAVYVFGRLIHEHGQGLFEVSGVAGGILELRKNVAQNYRKIGVFDFAKKKAKDLAGK